MSEDHLLTAPVPVGIWAVAPVSAVVLVGSAAALNLSGRRPAAAST